MLATSVAVVRKMLDAVAGSAPNRFSTSGINAPAKPADDAAAVIATSTTGRAAGLRIALHACVDPHAEAGGDADEHAVEKPSSAFLGDQPARSPGFRSPSVMPRRVTASAWQPVLPDWPASTGRKTASMTSCASVSSKTPTTRGRDEGGDEIDLQPGMAEAQAARERRVEPLLLVHADHLARLGGDLDRLVAEQLLAADQPLQPPLGVADRIDRIMLRDRCLQRLVQLHVLAE